MSIIVDRISFKDHSFKITDKYGEEETIELYRKTVDAKFKVPRMMSPSAVIPYRLTAEDNQTEVKLRDYQLDIYNQSLKTILNYGGAFLSLFCGFGKTIVSIKLAGALLGETGRGVVLIHMKTLIGQWEKTIEEVAPKLKGRLTPIMIEGAEKYPLSEVDLVIVDEARNFFTQRRLKKILYFHTKFIIGLSANIERPDGRHILLPKIFGRVIRRISDKIFLITAIFTPYVPIRKRYYFSGKLNWTLYCSSIALNMDRNLMIRELCRFEVMRDMYVLILTELKDQASLLHGLLAGIGIDSSLFIGKMKSYSPGDVLIGTYSKIGIGFDAKKSGDPRNIDVCILASPLKNIEQAIGRSLRSSLPHIYEIVDNDTMIKGYYKAHKKFYSKRNGMLSVVHLHDEMEEF